MHHFLLLGLFAASTAVAFESSEILNAANISIRPVLEKGEFLLIEAKAPDEKLVDVFLAGDDQEPIALQKVAEKPSKDVGLYDNPALFWKFARPQQKSKLKGAFFALVGQNVPKIAEFYAKSRLGGMGSIPDCALPQKGFITDLVHGYAMVDRKKQRDFTIVYTHSRLLTSTYKSMSQKDQESGEWFRERILFESQGSPCRELAQLKLDRDGMFVDKKQNPIGDVIGVLFLTKGEKKEAWIVVHGYGYESYGLTFLQAPLMPEQKNLGTDHFPMGGL